MFAAWPTWIRCSFCRTRLRFERVWDVALVLFGSVFGLTALVIVPGWPGDPADHGRWVWVGLLVLAVLGLEWLAARVLRHRRLRRT
jgi:hypothetical protein